MPGHVMPGRWVPGHEVRGRAGPVCGPAGAGLAGGGSPRARPSATTSSPTAQLQASVVNGVRAANADAASDDAVVTSMPWPTWSSKVWASPASAAATSTLVSLGASGSRSLSRFDIVCALESAATPSWGSVTIVRSASLASS